MTDEHRHGSGRMPFAPLRFEGMTKHSMATSCRHFFTIDQAILPYLDDLNPSDPATADFAAADSATRQH